LHRGYCTMVTGVYILASYRYTLSAYVASNSRIKVEMIYYAAHWQPHTCIENTMQRFRQYESIEMFATSITVLHFLK
jgi:hypothetical protein